MVRIIERKRHQQTCEECGKDFKSFMPTAKFCSPSCLSVARYKRRRNTCCVCGANFTGGQAKTCSRECLKALNASREPRKSHNQSRHTTHLKETPDKTHKKFLTCPHCGKTGYGGNRTVYCSVICGERAFLKKCENSGVNHTCVECGKVFKAYPGHGRKYCSLSCSLKRSHRDLCLVEKTCTECGMFFKAKTRGRHLFCEVCSTKHILDSAKKHGKRLGVLVGVGSGGAQAGAANSRWNPQSPFHGQHVIQLKYRDICFLYFKKECCICSSSGSIDVHHIDGQADDPRIENLMPMCRRCHNKVHSFVKKGAGAESYLKALSSVFPEWEKQRQSKLWPNQNCGIKREPGASGQTSGGESEPKAGSDASQGQRLVPGFIDLGL